MLQKWRFVFSIDMTHLASKFLFVNGEVACSAIGISCVQVNIQQNGTCLLNGDTTPNFLSWISAPLEWREIYVYLELEAFTCLATVTSSTSTGKRSTVGPFFPMIFKDLLSSKSLFLHVSNCVHRMPGCQWIPKISLDFGVVLQSLVGSRRKIV